MPKEKYVSEGEYHLTKLTLRKGVEVIDLKGLFIDIAIYESMFDQVISGDISITDVHGVDERTPMYGNEMIEIEFYTAGNSSNPISITGVVYKIDAKTQLSQSASGYIIRFTDEFLMKSSRLAYRYGHEIEIGKMVKQIYNNTMNNSVSDKKQIDIVPTSGIEHYVGTKAHPLGIINKLAEKSVSTSGEYGYMFYQDNQKFNFKPIEYLYKQDPVTEFINRDSGIFQDVKQHTVERFNAIQKIELADTNNVYAERLARGAHGSRWYSIDLISKRVIAHDYNKTSAFDKSKSLGTTPHLYNDISETTYDDLHITEVQANVPSGLQTKCFNLMQRENLFTFRATITTNGDSSLSVGQVAKVNLPNWDNSKQLTTKPYSGNFLITEIKHVLNRRTYIQSIMVQKDAYDVEFVQ